MSRGFICHPYLVPVSVETFDSVAELPRLSADPGAVPTVTGTTFTVNSGGNIQTALNSAAAADGALTHEIVIEAGATFTGTFTLPNRSGTNPSGTGWIIVRSANLSSLPANERVVPADTANMPLIRQTTNNTEIFSAASTARHYRLAGLEIAHSAAVTSVNSAGIGTDRGSTDIVIDRCYIHSNSTGDFRRGIRLNCNKGAVLHCYISGWHDSAADAQAVCCWDGAGPFYIYNNYMEGSGENLMFGGSAPSLVGLVPSDITIKHNHFLKPSGWRSGGTNLYSIKNLFEVKTGRRILVENNIFEQVWVGGQWEAIVLKSDSGAAECQAADITIRYNVIRNATSAMNISADPSGSVNEGTRRLSIHDNLFHDIGDFNGTNNDRMILTLNDMVDLDISNNTFHSNYAGQDTLLKWDTEAGAFVNGERFTFENNIASMGAQGMMCSGFSAGNNSINAIWNTFSITGNALVGSYTVGNYPGGNTQIATQALAFNNPAADDYTPIGSAVGKGCDYPTVLARTANVVAGTP